MENPPTTSSYLLRAFFVFCVSFFILKGVAMKIMFLLQKESSESLFVDMGLVVLCGIGALVDYRLTIRREDMGPAAGDDPIRALGIFLLTWSILGIFALMFRFKLTDGSPEENMVLGAVVLLGSGVVTIADLRSKRRARNKALFEYYNPRT
jgi:hypothetical protein